jgi:signal transduction histidine kinase
VEGTN